MFFMASTGSQVIELFARLFDLVAQKRGLLEILVADSLLQLLLQSVEFYWLVKGQKRAQGIGSEGLL